MQNNVSKGLTVNKTLILIALGMFTFMSTLDGSIVNIAMPIMSKELSVTASQIEWVVSIYLIIISSLLMFFGRLGDVVGKTRIFKIGTAIFIIGSLIAGINLGLPFLLFARGVQAVGAAMAMSNSFGITTSSFPINQRGRAMGFIGTFVALGSVAGPAVGGLILNYLPWNYIFWINVPIGIIAILLGLKSLPKDVPVSANAPLDWLGTLEFVVFIVTFFFAILRGQAIGYTHPIILGALLIAVVSIILFIRTEKQLKHPLLDFSIFKYSDFTFGLIAALLVFINGFFYNVLMPYYLVNARGLSSRLSGVLLSIIPLTMVIFGPIGGVLADKFNSTKITIIGVTLVLLAQFLIMGFQLGTPFWYFIFTSIVTGIGIGMFQSPNNASVMSAVPSNRLEGSLAVLMR